MKLLLYFKFVLISILSTALGFALLIAALFGQSYLETVVDRYFSESSVFLTVAIMLVFLLYFVFVIVGIPVVTALSPLAFAKWHPTDELVHSRTGRRAVLAYDKSETKIAVFAVAPIYVIFCLIANIIVHAHLPGTASWIHLILCIGGGIGIIKEEL